MKIDTQQPPTVGLESDLQSKIIDNAAPDQEEPIRVNAHEIEVLQIDDIKFIDGINDYPESERMHSVVCITELGKYCIDDAIKIIRAKEAGFTEIKCEVEYLSRHSDTDLKIRKTTRRIMASGGRAPFFPTAVNVRGCFVSLISTSEKLVIFGQGGDRLSSKFIGDRQHDGRLILRARCGRGPDSVNAYLSATEFVDSETQGYLFEEEATKAFFDFIRKEKSNLVNKLQSQRLTKEVISQEVSSAICGWYPQYKATGTILPFTSNILPAAKTRATAKAAAASSASITLTGPSKRSKKTAAPPAPPPPPANTGAAPAQVVDPEIQELANELDKNATDLNSLAETMKKVTDSAFRASFYFDFVAARNSLEDLFSRIGKHFAYDQNSEENLTEVG